MGVYWLLIRGRERGGDRQGGRTLLGIGECCEQLNKINAVVDVSAPPDCEERGCRGERCLENPAHGSSVRLKSAQVVNHSCTYIGVSTRMT